MFRKILTYGAIGGAIVGVFNVVVSFIDVPLPYGMFVGYSVMLVALSTVFVAIKQQRDVDQGGVIRFWPALALGLGISVVASIIYVVAWELSQTLMHGDFANGYADAMIAQKKAAGVSGAALKAFITEMDQFKVQYHDPLYRLPMTFIEIFPVGVLVSLVSAGLLCNSRFLPRR
ncbi:MAG TPA: DUF4199 domain-containing protein [Rhizomicrobium sp.]|jgi:hypothetical protein|nr:DUF4199 domain-containing protein [Rhizomicrobium sp.]